MNRYFISVCTKPENEHANTKRKFFNFKFILNRWRKYTYFDSVHEN